ncbi:hypothetical protein B484DRAFT_320707, partial [Ochromonadaceae sp. CCMP2298]
EGEKSAGEQEQEQEPPKMSDPSSETEEHEKPAVEQDEKSAGEQEQEPKRMSDPSETEGQHEKPTVEQE